MDGLWFMLKRPRCSSFGVISACNHKVPGDGHAGSESFVLISVSVFRLHRRSGMMGTHCHPKRVPSQREGTGIRPMPGGHQHGVCVCKGSTRFRVHGAASVPGQSKPRTHRDHVRGRQRLLRAGTCSPISYADYQETSEFLNLGKMRLFVSHTARMTVTVTVIPGKRTMC